MVFVTGEVDGAVSGVRSAGGVGAWEIRIGEPSSCCPAAPSRTAQPVAAPAPSSSAAPTAPARRRVRRRALLRARVSRAAPVLPSIRTPRTVPWMYGPITAQRAALANLPPGGGSCEEGPRRRHSTARTPLATVRVGRGAAQQHTRDP
ncbi:hypothetical protein GCM10009801_28890 [Streptomyces albiaxialis]|uniref:Uncharacterized protein n=1 Tax=Streptomyces albiaxialis TaxID=329523 RepID=A0ABP5HHY0_9ACTN